MPCEKFTADSNQRQAAEPLPSVSDSLHKNSPPAPQEVSNVRLPKRNRLLWLALHNGRTLHVPEDASEGFPQVPHRVLLVLAGRASGHGGVHGWGVGALVVRVGGLAVGVVGGLVVGVAVGVGHALGHLGRVGGALRGVGASCGGRRVDGHCSAAAAWHHGPFAAQACVRALALCSGPAGVPATGTHTEHEHGFVWAHHWSFIWTHWAHWRSCDRHTHRT